MLNKPLTDRIITAVCKEGMITRDAFFSTCRLSEHADCRHVVIFVLADMLGMSLSQVGKIVGRHHVTVIHGRDKIRSMLSRDDLPTTIKLMLDAAKRVIVEANANSLATPAGPPQVIERRVVTICSHCRRTLAVKRVHVVDSNQPMLNRSHLQDMSPDRLARTVNRITAGEVGCA